VGAVLIVGATSSLPAQEKQSGKPEIQPRLPRAIPVAQFDKLHKMIKPQSGESRFTQIPWLLSVWEGRQKAAAEGKPMLVWAGGWGVPIGVC
jgi:hypothetical protein